MIGVALPQVDWTATRPPSDPAPAGHEATHGERTHAHDVLRGMLPPSDEQPSRTPPDPDRVPEPWESGMQATCECLSWRGSLDNLERRRAEDELGESVYADFPVHSRSAVVVAHLLIDKGIFDPDELRTKMSEVRTRLETP